MLYQGPSFKDPTSPYIKCSFDINSFVYSLFTLWIMKLEAFYAVFSFFYCCDCIRQYVWAIIIRLLLNVIRVLVMNER